jgi:putative oxidoreductase
MAASRNKINYFNIGLLIIRIGLGLLFIYHGYPKMAGGQPTWERLGSATRYVGIHFWPALWGFLCAATELFGGFLLILGLAFRPVCLLLAINLIVAVAMQLGKGEGLLTASHALEDAIVFAGLFFIGPGKYSVDRK